ncbi:MAG TPA: MarR family transcriptional regulator, partial [Thermomicrobiales bacterium]
MERIEDCFVFLLGKAYQHLNQQTRQRLAPHGVTPAQYGLLELLWERDEQSGAELSERLQLDSATMTGLLDRLERAELVVRRPDGTDRRVNR